MTGTSERLRISETQLRIWREFHEMPGLRLTLGQACRLFGLGHTAGAEQLRGLVDAGVLRQVGQFYLRADLDAFVA